MVLSKLPRGVEVRGKSLRIVFTYKGQRCRPTLKGIEITPRNIKFAEQKRNAVLYEINNGAFDYAAHFPECPKARLFSPDKTSPTVKEATLKWLSIKKKTSAPSTYRGYHQKANKNVIDRWGQYRITDIRASEVREWIAIELHKLSNKTINEILIIMRGIFSEYGLDRSDFKNPFDHVKNLIVCKEQPDPFTREEITRILTTPTHRQSEINMLQAAMWCGLSLSEYIALAWEDIDLERGVLKISRAKVGECWKVPKTARREREIELIAPCIDAFKKQMQLTYLSKPIEVKVLQRDNKTYKSEKVTIIFSNTITKKPHNNDKTIREGFFRPHLKKAKVRYRGPNHCRHTFASQMLTIGMPKEWVATQMGHTSTAMIDKHYGRWIKEDAPDMAEIASKRLEKPLRRPTVKLKNS